MLALGCASALAAIEGPTRSIEPLAAHAGGAPQLVLPHGYLAVAAAGELGRVDLHAADDPSLTAEAGRSDAMPGGADAVTAERDRILRRSTRLLAGSVAAIYTFGLTSWWGDGFDTEFKSRPEGWFGPGTAHGGQDKLGHAMFTYAGTRLLKWGLESFGNDPTTALKLATVTTFGALTGVEVLDGFAKKWSFSREDAVMNLAGAAAAVVLETSPKLDGIVDLRIHYLPSRMPDGSRRSWEPISDYSGQTYYFVAKASGFEALDRIPVVRWLEASVGYGARGFEVGGTPTRISYVGVSLNLGKLLGETVLKDSGPKTRKVSDNLFEFVQFQTAGAWNERRF
jgi:hypothetical protein